VAIDVIRATTTAVTGVALGRKCYPVPTLEVARTLARMLIRPLLAGELEGNMPAGFEINNSPSELARRADIDRPMLLLSTSGTKLIWKYGLTQPVYVACLRNYHAQAAYLARAYRKIALIGAGSHGEFREEDILCCARLASCLLEAGYEPLNEQTKASISKWGKASLSTITSGKSARYLRESGQESDLDFVLTHINDLNSVYRFTQGQVIAV
jgi:2-phosphosulfolactate phosphatase